MAESVREVQVMLAGDGFYPQAFRWTGRDVRVLYVEGMRTRGLERRYRVRTVEGAYELSYHTRTGVWHMLRSPSWFSRALAQIERTPRYSLPVRQRRRGRASVASRGPRKAPRETPSSRGGGHANGIAMVR